MNQSTVTMQSEYTIKSNIIIKSNITFLDFLYREKFYANSYENPIVEKVTEQCPYLVKSLHEPYAKPLTGDEILNILCEEDCTRSAEEKHHKKENGKNETCKQNLLHRL